MRGYDDIYLVFIQFGKLTSRLIIIQRRSGDVDISMHCFIVVENMRQR
jgi:hypothetical protein